MAKVFNEDSIKYEYKESEIPEFAWHSSINLYELVKAKNLIFDIRLLEPGKYSYPYHSHRNAEELFVLLDGGATLRTPEGYQQVKEGDIIFFEMGPSGAHQLHNNTDGQCKFLDIRTHLGIDVCDYPDSGKVNILPYNEIYESETKVNYYKGEQDVKKKWQE